MQINRVRIGPGYKPYIIAEMSANHGQDLSRAIEMLRVAHSCGVDAIKLQTFTPDTITLDYRTEDFLIDRGLWKGTSLHELYERAYLPWSWYEEIFQKAHEIGLTIFSSVFDETSIEFLEKFDVQAYKISSFELVDLPLIKCVAKTGKPLILSTGIGNKEEIRQAVDAAREYGASQIALLHCVSGYPAPAEDYNLKTIRDLADSFSVVAGLSDHTTDNATSVVSVGLGASIIEKHFTLDRSLGGPDAAFSLEPDELKGLVRDVHTAWQAIGSISYRLKSSEKENIRFRRSLYFIKDLEAGDVVQPDSIKSIRPGFGLSPSLIDEVIGKRIRTKVFAGSPVREENLYDI